MGKEELVHLLPVSPPTTYFPLSMVPCSGLEHRVTSTHGLSKRRKGLGHVMYLLPDKPCEKN